MLRTLPANRSCSDRALAASPAATAALIARLPRCEAEALDEKHEILNAVEPVRSALIERIGPKSLADRRGPEEDAFASLARIITGQQVSTSAAREIWTRSSAKVTA